MAGNFSSYAICSSTTLVDDYKTVDIHDYQGANRYFNKLGGDYGQVGIEATYDTDAGNVGLKSLEASNFWFSKFDLGACFDLSGYSAIQFDIVAPPGTTASFTLTQKAPNCVDRLDDSDYMPLTKYIRPNGLKQTVTMQISDFANNVKGGRFDFEHLKDWTLNDLNPVGTTVFISNFMLLGGCSNALGSRANMVAQSAAATNPGFNLWYYLGLLL